jgi:hypothetical protein
VHPAHTALACHEYADETAQAYAKARPVKEGVVRKCLGKSTSASAYQMDVFSN